MPEQKTRLIGSKTGKLEGESVGIPLGQGIMREENVRNQLKNYDIEYVTINGKPYIIGKRK